MSSKRRKEAARANGAKSRGPRTPEGKAVSSRNALKHGFNAQVVVLDNESEEEFHKLREAYFAELAPRGQVEADLVDQIVVARWCLQRNWAMATSLINVEMLRQKRRIEEEFNRIDEDTRKALALKAQADNSNALALLNRYEIRDQRTIRRTLETLRRLRQEPEKQIVQNEPGEPPVPAPEPPSDPAPAKTGTGSSAPSRISAREQICPPPFSPSGDDPIQPDFPPDFPFPRQ